MYESNFEEKLYNERRDKLRQIAALGQKRGLTYAAATYPNSYASTHTIPELRAAYDPISAEQFEAAHAANHKPEVSIAGRIMAIRVQGKAGFAQLQQNGQRMQIYVRKDDVGEDAFALYKLLDLGDHIGVRGFPFRTRTGELTVHVTPGATGEPALTFLAKAMLALPDKYHGLEDTELRYRQRYVDLFMNTGHSPKPTTPPAAASSTAPPQEAVIPPQNSVILSEAKNPRISSAAPQTSAPPEAVILSEAKDPDTPRPATTAENLSPTESPASEPLNVREVFVKRARILRALRTFFDTRGYLEVETPMMHTVAGGAAARPFLTHHNALSLDLKLRIAPELYLKRLVVGGMDRVYEINRNFRNEGISTQHNPEFTMLEFYQAYSNYHDLMDLTQELITTVATEVNGTPITHFNGHEIDLSKWTKLSMREAIIKWWRHGMSPGPQPSDFESRDKFTEAVGRIAWYCTDISKYLDGITDPSPKDLNPGNGFDTTLANRALWHQNRSIAEGILRDIKGDQVPLGKCIAAVFELLGERFGPHLIQPTLIYDYPLAVSPLSKQKPDEPDWVERFEFYIGGFEIGNAFSELNDPDDQRARFAAQLLEKARGDEEAMAEVDEDYVRALGYGLPPTAGEGIGIDRLTMILTGSRSIRDVILFPLLRPHTKPTPTEPDETQTP